MSAVRTEQEARCTMGKAYWGPDQRASVSTLAKAGVSPNYNYELLNGGVEAQREGKYVLRMWYKTGEICCEGAGCEGLSKNYPACSAAPVDECITGETTPPPYSPSVPCTGPSTQSCGCKGGGTQSRTCDTSTGSWSDWGACTISDACPCEGDSTRPCGCNGGGTQSRTCDTSTGSWSNFGACSISDDCPCEGNSTEPCGCNNGGTRSRTCDTSTGSWSNWGACSISDECPDCDENTKPAATQACGNCGTQTRSVTCDTSTGTWVTGDWGNCSGQGICEPDEEQTEHCGPAASTAKKDRICTESCTWSNWTVCYCPSGRLNSQYYCCDSNTPYTNTHCYSREVEVTTSTSNRDESRVGCGFYNTTNECAPDFCESGEWIGKSCRIITERGTSTIGQNCHITTVIETHKCVTKPIP